MPAVGLDRIKVNDLMTEKVYSVECDSKLSETLGLMRKNRVTELVVMRRGKLAGILSYDILLKRMNLPLNAKVESLITLSPRLSPDDSVVTAAEILLSAGLRTAPVTSSDNKLVGIISRTDLVGLIPEYEELAAQSVGSVMSKSPVCVGEGDTIARAKGLMKGLGEPTIPVVNASGRLSGLVDMKEVGSILWSSARRQKRGADPKSRKMEIYIKSVMRPPVSVPVGTNIGTAIGEMMKNDLENIVVTANEKPVGILSQADLIELIARKTEKESIYVQITGLAEDDPFVYESIYSIIEKGMKRIARIASPQMFLLHVSQYYPRGSTSKFSIRGRLSTSKKMYYAQSVEWDIMRATDNLVRELDGLVRRDKEKTMGSKRIAGMKATLAKYER